MDFRQIRYFIAVADARNFSRAAERLHVSQPPLSIQVKRLEDEIGVRLFARSPRGVELTPAGALFYEDAKAALARLDSAKKRARQAELGEVGTLSIGFVSIVDYGVLPPALKDFRTRYPRIEVELHEATTDQQVQALRSGRFDLALALGPVREADLKFEPLIEEELLLALPARHPLAGADRATDLRRFCEEKFIAPPRELAPGLHDAIVARCRGSGFTPRMGQQARQMQTVVSLVACGLGVALVPASMRNLKRKGLIYRRLRGAAEPLQIGLLTRAGEGSAVVRNFSEVLRGHAGG